MVCGEELDLSWSVPVGCVDWLAADGVEAAGEEGDEVDSELAGGCVCCDAHRNEIELTSVAHAASFTTNLIDKHFSPVGIQRMQTAGNIALILPICWMRHSRQ